MVLFGLIGGLSSPTLLSHHDELGLLFPLVGCISGGLVYRYRSRKWPIDYTVTRRLILLFGALSIVLASFVLTTGDQTQGFGIVLIVSAVLSSVAIGFLVAARRRDGHYVKQD